MSAAGSTPLLDSDAVGWHEAECASYTADLPLWRELAEEQGDPVLDLGCGTGRVAIDLARRGHRVLALDRDPELLAALRARARGLPVRTLLADAREPEPGEPVALAIAPMQLLQLLEGPGERGRVLRGLREALGPGGRAAIAIVEAFDAELALPGGVRVPAGIEPEVAELDGRRYESLPLRVSSQHGALSVERRRRRLAEGEPPRTEHVTVRLEALDAAGLEREARRAGLAPTGRRRVPPTAVHVGSTVVLLEAASR